MGALDAIVIAVLAIWRHPVLGGNGALAILESVPVLSLNAYGEAMTLRATPSDLAEGHPQRPL